MIVSLDNIKKDLCEDILAIFNKGVSIKDISNLFSIGYNEILAIIHEEDEKNSMLTSQLSQYNLEEEPFIIISDTHFGSLYDNPRYIERVYEFAIENNIKTILHIGDFYQSTIRPTNKKLCNLTKQVEYGVRVYPVSPSIKNYILLGNHDYHLFKHEGEYYQIMSSRKDFNILGFRKAYFTWCKHLFVAHHEVDKYRTRLPKQEPFLKLCGHRHEIHLLGNHTIYVPTLSDDLKYYANRFNQPGFMVVRKEEERLKIKHYMIKDLTDTDVRTLGSKIVIMPQGIVLTKKL